MLMSSMGTFARVQQVGCFYSMVSIVALIHFENSIDRVDRPMAFNLMAWGQYHVIGYDRLGRKLTNSSGSSQTLEVCAEGPEVTPTFIW